ESSSEHDGVLGRSTQVDFVSVFLATPLEFAAIASYAAILSTAILAQNAAVFAVLGCFLLLGAALAWHGWMLDRRDRKEPHGFKWACEAGGERAIAVCAACVAAAKAAGARCSGRS
ncbi:unnamed protein product, partial [Phaeothamnion confervicola]